MKNIGLRECEVKSMARLLGVSFGAESEAEALGKLGDALRAMARRDWDVRVLDAWAAEVDERNVAPIKFQDSWVCRFRRPDTEWDTDEIEDHGSGLTPDAARHAAALAVFPTLDRSAPNWPGECP